VSGCRVFWGGEFDLVLRTWFFVQRFPMQVIGLSSYRGVWGGEFDLVLRTWFFVQRFPMQVIAVSGPYPFTRNLTVKIALILKNCSLIPPQRFPCPSGKEWMFERIFFAISVLEVNSFLPLIRSAICSKTLLDSGLVFRTWPKGLFFVGMGLIFLLYLFLCFSSLETRCLN